MPTSFYEDLQSKTQRVFNPMLDTQRMTGQNGAAKTNYNPFLKSDGSLTNPYAKEAYKSLIGNTKTNEKVREWLKEATGYAPEQTVSTVNQPAGSLGVSVSGETAFNPGYDAGQLAKLDIKTELPKLNVNQIQAVISKHFPSNSVLKAQDADGIFKAQQQTGMSALAILGIGALESGWGTSNIARQKGNLWGWNATNSNPGGNATDFSGGNAATSYAEKFMKTYYNGYGAKSIFSAGTGNNPSGKGYAYHDNGTIDGTWADKVGSIMGTLYNTAKASAPTVNTATGGNTSIGNKIVNTASKYLGTPYVWGGTTPKGFDCSGLMQYVYKEMGYSIPRVSQDQAKAGRAVDKSQLQPGDLVFFKGSGGSASNPGHVGMYIGNGQYLHAPKTGDVVKISNLSSRSDYTGARRIIQ